jgi:ubiquinol-cytochrome c reductase cytochrome c1 subunit
MKKILFLASLLAASMAFASSEGHLDKAPINLGDQQSLQRGVKTFVTYCLPCHSARAMRYNRLRDIGLTEQQIKENLIFTGVKVGELMTSSMNSKDAKVWFGVPPPDLSVVARARGADWLYTFLRGFYRDDTRPSGWNNTVFDKVGMPNVLFQLQGEQRFKATAAAGKEGSPAGHTLALDKPGTMTVAQSDAMVADLVNYLVFMGEPARAQRTQLGVYVLLFLAVFLVVAIALKKEYWKDIH